MNPNQDPNDPLKKLNDLLFNKVGPTINTLAVPGAAFMQNTPIGKFLFPTTPNTAQDIGAGLASRMNPGTQQSQQAEMDMAKKVYEKSLTTTDPEEKARLQSVAAQGLQAISQGSQSIASGFSPDVQKNPLGRAIQGGMEIGTGTDIISHPISTIKGIWNTAKAVTTGLPKTLKTLGKGIDTVLNKPEVAAQAVKDFATKEINNPQNWKLMTDPHNPINKIADWIRASAYKGSGVVANPTEVLKNLAGYGADSPDKIKQGAQLLTGENGILSSRVNASLAGASDVAVTDITGLETTSSVNKNLRAVTGVSPATKKEAVQFVRQSVNNAANDPVALHQAQQDIAQEASNYWDSFAENKEVGNKKLAQFYSNVSKDLLNLLAEGSTNAVSGVTQFGANHIPMAPLTDAESASLRALSPQLEADTAEAIASNDIRQVKHAQQLWTLGDQLTTANAKAAPSGIAAGQNLLLALGHPQLAAAETPAGKLAIAKGLNTVGNLNAGPAQFATDVIAKTASGELLSGGVGQAQNKANNGQNPNQGLQPPSMGGLTTSGSISQPSATVNYADLPKSINDIQLDVNGNVPAPIMPENILGPDGQPIAIGGPQGRIMEQKLADAVTKADTYNRVQGGTTEALNALGQAQNALTSFQQKRKDSEPLAILGEKANATYAAANDLIGQLNSTASINLLQNVPTIDALYNMTDPSYGGLKQAVQQFSLYHPNDIKTIWSSHNPTAMVEQLKQLQRYDQDQYFQNIRASLGISNQGSSQVPITGSPTVQESYTEANTPINNVPAIPQGRGTKYGSAVSLPGGGGAGLPPLPKQQTLPPLRIPQRYEYR